MLPRLFYRCFALFVLLTASSEAQIVVGQVTVSGTSRLPGAAVVELTGLKPGQHLTDRQLTGVCQKLIDSGFFVAANYSYAPERVANGGFTYKIAFTVQEDQTLVPVSLDIDDLDEASLWPKLKAADGLLDSRMPDNDGAQNYYAAAIAKTLSAVAPGLQVMATRQAEISSKTMQVVFRRANAPKVQAVKFEANSALDSETLEHLVHNIVIGSSFSEREFRQILNLNVIPAYGEKGYLQASIGKITRTLMPDGSVTATVTVAEGRPWKLGSVEFVGDSLPASEMRKAGDFPLGGTANWRLILASIEKAQRVLRADGYLQASADPERSFHDDTGAVDLHVQITKGAQFLFGALQFEGADPDLQDVLSRRWELRAGTPMNEPYTDEYWRQVYTLVHRRNARIERRFVQRPGTQTMDVVFKIN